MLEHARPGQKATPEGLQEASSRVRAKHPCARPVCPQELRAQHLNKSPKGKRAIPGAGRGGCHPRALTLLPPSHQWLVWDSPAALGSSLCQFCALRCGAKPVPVLFAQRQWVSRKGSWPWRGCDVVGAWLGSPACVNLCASAAWARADLRRSPEFVPCSCVQVPGPSLDLGLQPLLHSSFNYLWGFILIFSSGSRKRGPLQACPSSKQLITESQNGRGWKGPL